MKKKTSSLSVKIVNLNMFICLILIRKYVLINTKIKIFVLTSKTQILLNLITKIRKYYFSVFNKYIFIQFKSVKIILATQILVVVKLVIVRLC